MQPRDLTLIRQRQQEKSVEHRERLLKAWFSSVPQTYQGHKTAEIRENSWNGRLSQNGRVDLLRYLKNPTRFLLLYGDAGTGKSTLAATLATRLIAERHVAARYRVAPTLLDSFSWRENGQNPLREASEAPVLLLDDLGAGNEGKSPAQARALWSLIDARWSNPNHLTLMTTNMSITSTSVRGGGGVGLIDWITPTAWDRIGDDLTMVELKGKSHRGNS